MKRNSKWIPAGRVMILLSLVILFFNAYSFFREVRRTMIYNSRTYGLEVLNDYFDSGNYYEIYMKTTQNRYSEKQPVVDVSQYEAFGQYYHNYIMARTHADNRKYLDRMKEARAKVTWKKILNQMDRLEAELP